MQTRQLGGSDLHLTPLGIGAWAMGGGGWAFAWGPQDDEQSIRGIRAALDAGMNWIDTAAVYGLGHSEEVVGRALQGMANRPYVFTKCARTWTEQRQITKTLKADSVRRECEASLRRLRVDTIDLYQVHWPEPDEDIEEGWGMMARLQKEGKVRWIGVSNFNVAQMERARAIAPVTSLQPPYSMLVRGIEAGILPYAGQNGIGVISYSPMRNGLLSGSMTRERVAAFPPDDFRRNLPDYQEPRLSRNLGVAELLRTIGAPHGRTPGEVAIAWVLRRPEVTAAIVGVRGPEQIQGVIGAGTFRLSADEVAAIEVYLEANPV
jgi:aryl-alcohol dehydrogenase-like predicted oxidoreductase